MTRVPTPMLALTRQLSGAAMNSRRRIAPAVSSAFGKTTQRRASAAPAKACSTAPVATHSGTIQPEFSKPLRMTASALVTSEPSKMAGQMRGP